VLAGAVLRDLRSQPDQQFQLAAKTVLSENAELYRRLRECQMTSTRYLRFLVCDSTAA